MMKKWFLIFSIFAGIHLSAQVSYIQLKNLDGDNIQLSDAQGEKLTVVDFWATWCKPCLAAIPKINQLSREFQSDEVAFWGINIDSPRNMAKVKPFLKSLNVGYPVFLDPDQELMGSLNVHAMPTLLILDSKGKVKFFHEGFQLGDEEIIKNEIEKLLQQ